jgi:hypothetical protein
MQINTMSSSKEPSAILSHLHSTDGSATFSQNGYTIIGAVNGPIEVQRRDELPEEAAIDVIVRPAAGVGTTRERHLESIIERTLRQIVLISNFPRTLIQVTLQVASTPPDETATSKSNQTSSVYLIHSTPVIPWSNIFLSAESTYLARITPNRDPGPPLRRHSSFYLFDSNLPRHL